MKTINKQGKKEDKMKSARSRLSIFMLMALAVMLVPGMAMAVGTSVGTVNNTATLNYTVATVPQTAIQNTASFEVDRKVDILVARMADATVSPGLVNGVLEYYVANNSNDIIGFTLNYESISNTISGGMSNLEIWIEDGTTPGFQDTEDTLYTIGNNAFDLAENATADVSNRIVYIVADTPIGASNGQQEDFALIANAVDAGLTSLIANTATPNTVGIDNVLADGAGTATGDVAYDGLHSATATYFVSSAVITVNKNFVGVYSDPINGTNGNQKAIPGAVVEYEIVINHTTGSDAVLTTLTDTYDSASVGLTTYGAQAYDFEVFCNVVAADEAVYSCEPGPDTYSAGGAITDNGTGTLSFDISQLLPAAGTHTTNGEIKATESLTIRYMMQITP